MKELMAKMVWIRRASYLNETRNLLIFIYPKNWNNPNRLKKHTHTPRLYEFQSLLELKQPWKWDDVIL